MSGQSMQADASAQTLRKGFQCCSCCGEPGHKKPTCSCVKPVGYTHVCCREQAVKAKQQLFKKKWRLFVLHFVFQGNNAPALERERSRLGTMPKKAPPPLDGVAPPPPKGAPPLQEDAGASVP